MKIKNEVVVTLTMKVTDQDGNVLEDTPADEPFLYLHGAQNILPALEDVLVGKKAGDTVEVTLGPDEAYGAHDESLLQVMTHEELEDVENLQVGDYLEGETEDGIIPLTVASIDDDGVTVDANHPFAGMSLNFILKISDVRAATEEEVEHGHAHGEEECEE